MAARGWWAAWVRSISRTSPPRPRTETTRCAQPPKRKARSHWRRREVEGGGGGGGGGGQGGGGTKWTNAKVRRSISDWVGQDWCRTHYPTFGCDRLLPRQPRHRGWKMRCSAGEGARGGSGGIGAQDARGRQQLYMGAGCETKLGGRCVGLALRKMLRGGR